MASYSLTNSVALIEAAKKGDAAAIVDLLKKNADVEFVDKASANLVFPLVRGHRLLPPVERCAHCGRTNTHALQNGYDKRPLHWASQEGHLAAVKALVKAGAEVRLFSCT